jgi:DNA repair protein RecO (recombination protein O)
MPDMGSAPKLMPGSRAIALEMLRTPVAQLSQTGWDQGTAADLRRFLVRQIETHIERRLITAPLLEPGGRIMATDEHG